MKQLSHVWFIALKELRLFVTDRLALLFAILFPFIFVVVFSFMLSDVGGGDDRLELHLATQEVQGALSYQIIASMVTADESLLEYEVLEDSDEKFEVHITKCRYADFYLEQGEPEIG